MAKNFRSIAKESEGTFEEELERRAPNPTCRRPGGAGKVSAAKFALDGSSLQSLGLASPAGLPE